MEQKKGQTPPSPPLHLKTSLPNSAIRLGMNTSAKELSGLHNRNTRSTVAVEKKYLNGLKLKKKCRVCFGSGRLS